MNLGSYIKEFLLENEVVEIPQLGTFELQYIPPLFDEKNQTFSAPKKTILFSNKQAGNKDIIPFIAKKEFIDQATAAKSWNIYVASLINKLNKTKSYTFEELGTLEIKDDKTYLFTPHKNLVLLESAFGLEDLTNVQKFKPTLLSTRVESIDTTENTLPVISKEEEIVVSEKINEQPPIIQEQEEDVVFIKETTEEQIPVIDEKESAYSEKQPIEDSKEVSSIPSHLEEQNIEKIQEEATVPLENELENIILEEETSQPTEEPQEQNTVEEETVLPNIKEEHSIAEEINIPKEKQTSEIKNTNKTKRTLFRVILALTVMCILYLCYLYYEKYEKTKADAEKGEVLPKPKKEEVPVFIAEETVIDSVPLATSENTKDINTVGGFEISTTSHNGIDIIVGFFKVEKNALKEAKRMQAFGCKPYIIKKEKPNTTHFFVSIGSFKEEAEAIAFMKKFYEEKKIEVVLKKW